MTLYPDPWENTLGIDLVRPLFYKDAFYGSICVSYTLNEISRFLQILKDRANALVIYIVTAKGDYLVASSEVVDGDMYYGFNMSQVVRYSKIILIHVSNPKTP